MKILIVGAKGSIGKRWCAVAKYLGHKTIEVDIDNEELISSESYDRAIVATPTITHKDVVESISEDVQILCEKPFVNEDDENFDIPDNVRIVNNWSYFTQNHLKIGSHRIQYLNFTCGNESLFENLFQPLAYSKNYSLDLNSPFLKISIDNKVVSHEDIENSYMFLFEDWIKDSKHAGFDKDEYHKAHRHAKHWFFSKDKL